MIPKPPVSAEACAQRTHPLASHWQAPVDTISPRPPTPHTLKASQNRAADLRYNVARSFVQQRHYFNHAAWDVCGMHGDDRRVAAGRVSRKESASAGEEAGADPTFICVG